jgi:hypothetical protein
MRHLFFRLFLFVFAALAFNACNSPTSGTVTGTTNWTTEDSTSNYSLTFTNTSPTDGTFNEVITPKGGGASVNSAGTIHYDLAAKVATWTYTQPAPATIRSSFDFTDSGKTFVYTITESPISTLPVGAKYTYHQK